MSNVSIAHAEFIDAKNNVPLIQFWDKDIPDAVAELVHGVADNNPALNYQLFDDQTAAEYIRTEFGSEILKHYRSCAIPAMRADLFRYCFLARQGGFYIDADFSAVSSIEPIVNSQWRACLYQRDIGLSNAMMYFRDSNDPLAEKILENALCNINSRSSNSVWKVTGPQGLRKLHAEHRNSDLFKGIYLMDESEVAKYFKAVKCLDYKKDDSHWLVAKAKGLEIFR